MKKTAFSFKSTIIPREKIIGKSDDMPRELKQKLWSFKACIFGVVLIIIAVFLHYFSLKSDSSISLFLGGIGLIIIVLRIIRPRDW